MCQRMACQGTWSARTARSEGSQLTERLPGPHHALACLTTPTVPPLPKPQVLLQKRGLRLNPVTTLYYVAPCCLGFLAIPWAFLEAPKLLGDPKALRPDVLVFLSNAAAAFALNMSVCLCPYNKLAHGGCKALDTGSLSICNTS